MLSVFFKLQNRANNLILLLKQRFLGKARGRENPRLGKFEVLFDI